MTFFFFFFSRFYVSICCVDSKDVIGVMSTESLPGALEELTPISYQEQVRRQTILNSLESKDYLLVLASQQQKSVQQVKYELMIRLTET